MKYYKLIQGSIFIGISTSDNFVKYQPKNHLYVTADETTAEFIECKGSLYRSSWMPPVPSESTRPFEQVIVLEITQEEYNTYKEAEENNEEIIINNDDDYVPPIIIDDDPAENASIDFIRGSKINAMSYACHITIEQGFDLELRGETKHFSLTTQDQLNLMSLSMMVQIQELIPYHADGEESTFYTADEIKQIIDAAAAFKNYHLAYYHALKAYINDLDTIEDIAAIEYGTPIPDEYKSDVLMVLE